MPQNLLDALTSDTKLQEQEDGYMEFVKRAGRNNIRLVVKIADLQDNLNLTCISSPTEKDHQWLERHRNASALLDDPSSMIAQQIQEVATCSTGVHRGVPVTITRV